MLESCLLSLSFYFVSCCVFTAPSTPLCHPSICFSGSEAPEVPRPSSSGLPRTQDPVEGRHVAWPLPFRSIGNGLRSSLLSTPAESTACIVPFIITTGWAVDLFQYTTLIVGSLASCKDPHLSIPTITHYKPLYASFLTTAAVGLLGYLD